MFQSATVAPAPLPAQRMETVSERINSFTGPSEVIAKGGSLMKRLHSSFKRTLTPTQHDDMLAAASSADEIRSRLSSKLEMESTREPQVLFKKTVYKVDVSLVYGVLLLVLALIDLYAVHREWDTEGVPANWHSALLYTHVVAFYMLATGYVVCNETHQTEYRRVATISLFINFVAFALRLHYELSFADFIPAQYYVSAP